MGDCKHGFNDWFNCLLCLQTSYATQAAQIALARAEAVDRIRELGAEGEHDRDYYLGYDQACKDAIAALRRRNNPWTEHFTEKGTGGVDE